MSVYVDDALIPYGRMQMCHMLASTHKELMVMADKLGLDPKWLQKPNTPEEHFDISKGKRQLAIELGAIASTGRDLVNLIRFKRNA
jgi:hypothetical protein